METNVVVEGLCFGEGPRWHEGRLWFSDMHASTVYALNTDHSLEKIVELDDDQPSGLGWLPDNRLLIISMQKRQLLVHDGTSVAVLADLSSLASYHCNDMVTDAHGRSWVGNFGFDLHSRTEPKAAELILVEPDGSARVVADDMRFPNGTVITPDDKTLIVGESMAARLTAFDLAADGSLSNRRVWAQLEGAVPDGICLDEAGGIWVASPSSNEVLRVVEGGEVSHRVPLDRGAFACMLGGEDKKTLYILAAKTSHPEKCVAARSGQVLSCSAPYAGAGLP